MTTLAIWFAILLVAALALLLWPLLKHKTSTKNHKVVYGILAFVPVFSMGLYFYLGTPQFADIQKTMIQPEVVTMVDKLEQKMAQNPQDINGWLLLGRSYMIEENYPKAVQAFERALKLDPNNLNALLPLADAIAVQNNGNLTGRPYELLKTALPLAPENTMTLWLLGMAEKQREDKSQAIDYWLKLYDLLPPDHADRTTILGLLSSVGYIPGIATLPQPTRAAPNADLTPSNADNSATKNTQAMKTEPEKRAERKPDTTTFVLIIEEQFIQQHPEATLFLYVKEPKGMPMPIAAKQIPLNRLPAGKSQIVLTKDDTIMPNRQIKDFKEITLGYRVMDKASIDQGKILLKQEQTVLQENQGGMAEFIITY